jgi:hypothetical protein
MSMAVRVFTFTIFVFHLQPLSYLKISGEKEVASTSTEILYWEATKAYV